MGFYFTPHFSPRPFPNTPKLPPKTHATPTEMKRLLLILALLPLAACGPEEYTWNQRMTLVVETPDGIVSGSSVVEVNATYCPDGCGLARDQIGSFSYRGEAVAVEVLPGQWLFALIGTPGELIYHARPDLYGDIRRTDRGAWARLIPNETEPVELTDALRPRLVTFDDMNDPWTAQQVDPDELAAIFGDGVRLVQVTLEVTQDLPDIGRIQTILPSLGDFPENRLVDQIDAYNPSFAQSLRTGSFVRR